MAKDPAYLFYSDNFLSGTMFLSDEQIGKYIRLLCAQHLTGHLHEKDMIKICKTKDEDIWKKFNVDSVGLYYNERLELEINKRKKFTESRSNNRLGKVKTKKTTPKKKSKSYDPHMEDEDEIENEDINNIKKVYLKFFENKDFEQAWKNFHEMRKKIKKPMTLEAEKLTLKELEEFSIGKVEIATKILNKSIQNSWQGVFPLKKESYEKGATANKPNTAYQGSGPGNF
jgi:uncharacterized protein YdaU (DUF1376 family)